jgi:hypothetical protein
VFVNVNGVNVVNGVTAGAEAIIIVTSAIDPKSFLIAEQWVLTLQDILPFHQLHSIPTLLVKNKSDLSNLRLESFSSETLNRYCAVNGLMGWRSCSASSGEGVSEIINDIIQVVVRFGKVSFIYLFIYFVFQIVCQHFGLPKQNSSHSTNLNSTLFISFRCRAHKENVARQQSQISPLLPRCLPSPIAFTITTCSKNASDD